MLHKFKKKIPGKRNRSWFKQLYKLTLQVCLFYIPVIYHYLIFIQNIFYIFSNVQCPIKTPNVCAKAGTILVSNQLFCKVKIYTAGKLRLNKSSSKTSKKHCQVFLHTCILKGI